MLNTFNIAMTASSNLLLIQTSSYIDNSNVGVRISTQNASSAIEMSLLVSNKWEIHFIDDVRNIYISYTTVIYTQYGVIQRILGSTDFCVFFIFLTNIKMLSVCSFYSTPIITRFINNEIIYYRMKSMAYCVLHGYVYWYMCINTLPPSVYCNVTHNSCVCYYVHKFNLPTINQFGIIFMCVMIFLSSILLIIKLLLQRIQQSFERNPL